MHALKVIEAACAQAIEEAEEGTPGWEKVYAGVVTPLDARELCAFVRRFIQYAADNGDQALVDELRRAME